MWTPSFRDTGGRPAAAAVALGLLMLSCASLARADDAQAAVWKPKQLDFVYQGFTTRYSCEGLASKVKSILLSLGARKDLTAYGTGCAVSSGHPAPFPGVRIRMNVLEAATADADAKLLVPAHWKTVDLKLDTDPASQAGECELIEQVSQKIMPLFSARNVDLKATCVPHKLTPGTRLSAQVLKADPVADAPR